MLAWPENSSVYSVVIFFLRRSLCLLTALPVLAVAGEQATGVRPAVAVNKVAPAAAKARLVESYGKLPLGFEANQGQTNPRVQFLSRGRGYGLFLTPNEAVLSLQGGKAEVKGQKAKGKSENLGIAGLRSPNPESGTPAILRLKLVGAEANPRIEGLEELPGKSNYFIGNDSKQWRTGVSNYRKVRYESVYRGVDLVYYGNQGQLEYDWIVAPGADPKTIKFAIEGAEKVGIDPAGDLVLVMEGGEVRFHKPVVYQEPSAVGRRPSAEAGHHQSTIDNRQFLDGRYVLRTAKIEDRNSKFGNPKSKIENPKYEVAFEVGPYDESRPLVIDPVLSYSTYLGGSQSEIGYGVAVDAAGNAYVTGSTGSVDFPAATPYQSASGGDFDVFVAKVNPTGTALIFSTYLGGNGYDRGTGIAVDSAGDVYLTGFTNSNLFPTKEGAFQTTFGGGTCGTTACSDAFVTKLKSDGSALVYSTYLGGSNSDAAQGIALAADGTAYVIGSTFSTSFGQTSPLRIGAGGNSDVFVAAVKPDGSGLAYLTFLGGSGADYGQAIGVDSAGNAYVTGYTFSTNFPKASALQGANAGSADAFVAKLNPAGSALVYSTYLGGTGVDRAFSLALDGANNVFITGDTASANFPVSATPYQPAYGGGDNDAFVAKINSAGSALLYATFLGGTDSDAGLGIAVDGTGQAFVTGYTRSADFPIHNGLQTVFGGGDCDSGPCPDAFVAVLDPTGVTPVYFTFFGGSASDSGQALALDAAGNAYVAGSTTSPNLPVTLGAVQVVRGGNNPNGDAFLAKIGLADDAAVAISPQTLAFPDQATGFTSSAKYIILTNSGSAALTVSKIVTSGDFAQTNTCGASVAPGGATCAIRVTFTPTATGDRTGNVTITDDAAGSPHVIPLTGKGVPPAPAVTLSTTSVDFGDQTYGTTSTPQTITLTNSGTAALTITAIAATGDFAQTHTCPVSPATLAVAASCTITLTFKPTASGARTGALTITDNGSNATSGKHTVSLKGNGIAVFSLSATATSVIVTRGTDSTTFAIKATAPSSFTSSITLACGNNGAATCAFSPASIKPGETSTLTLAALKQLTLATLNFQVTGTVGTQIASLSLAVNFADFTLVASPAFGTVASGDSIVFALTLTPTNGFSGSATFSCSGLPLETTCTFSPTSVTLDGKTLKTVQATLKTTVRTTEDAPPRSWPLWPWITGLAILGAVTRFWTRPRRWVPAWVSLTAALLVLVLFLSSCTQDFFRFRGTNPGTFTVALNAKVGDTTHSAFVSLTVN